MCRIDNYARRGYRPFERGVVKYVHVSADVLLEAVRGDSGRIDEVLLAGGVFFVGGETEHNRALEPLGINADQAVALHYCNAGSIISMKRGESLLFGTSGILVSQEEDEFGDALPFIQMMEPAYASLKGQLDMATAQVLNDIYVGEWVFVAGFHGLTT